MLVWHCFVREQSEANQKAVRELRGYRFFQNYVSDLGLLCAKKDVVPEDVLYSSSELNDFKGTMSENYVDAQLVANGYTPYYWEYDREAEVDFVIQRQGRLIPIEVKLADNARAKSLMVYMNAYQPSAGLRH